MPEFNPDSPAKVWKSICPDTILILILLYPGSVYFHIPNYQIPELFTPTLTIFANLTENHIPDGRTCKAY